MPPVSVGAFSLLQKTFFAVILCCVYADCMFKKYSSRFLKCLIMVCIGFSVWLVYNSSLCVCACVFMVQVPDESLEQRHISELQH